MVGPLASGPHKITLTVSDSDGNKASAFTNILVTGTVLPPDTTLPLVTPPPDQQVVATNSSGALVYYPAATATDNVGVTSGPTCNPPSGSIFPLGTTLVTCTATDAEGNIGTATFNVTVGAATPPGTVSWSDGGAGGTFSISDYCTLSSGSCTVTYTPAKTSSTTIKPLSAGPVMIKAEYSGDCPYAPSSVFFTLPVPSTPTPLDTTPPEAYNQFDPATKDIQVFGRDSSFGTSGPLTPTSVTKLKVTDLPGPKLSSFIPRIELRTYHISDLAGNSITLVEKVKKQGHAVIVQMISVKYNDGPVVPLEENEKLFEWTLNKDGTIKQLEQDMTVGPDGSKQHVTVDYDSRKDTSVVTVLQPTPGTSSTSGLVLLRMATSNGDIIIEQLQLNPEE